MTKLFPARQCNFCGATLSKYQSEYCDYWCRQAHEEQRKEDEQADRDNPDRGDSLAPDPIR